MATTVVPGQLVALAGPAEVAREAAARIGRALGSAIGKCGSASVALSGGSTPLAAFALLARESEVDWTQVDVFWVDERAVSPTDDRSNYRWAKATLLDNAAIPASKVHRMRAESADRDAAAREYERLIGANIKVDADGVPAFDLVVLGIGEDAHTASLFPGEAAVDIVDRLVVAVPAKGKREARLTITSPVIEHARAVIVIAVGIEKRDALERVWLVQGDKRETPARVIRECLGAVTWIIDKAAGGLLE